ncbi:hypothetical protein ACBQ20_02015 [Proteus vulgaris]
MSQPHNPEIPKIINELKQQYKNAVDDSLSAFDCLIRTTAK